MTAKKLRRRLAEFMVEYFPTEVKKSLPGWDCSVQGLFPYIDPIRDVPYIILAIRSGGYSGYDDLVALGVKKG